MAFFFFYQSSVSIQHQLIAILFVLNIQKYKNKIILILRSTVLYNMLIQGNIALNLTTFLQILV